MALNEKTKDNIIIGSSPFIFFLLMCWIKDDVLIASISTLVIFTMGLTIYNCYLVLANIFIKVKLNKILIFVNLALIYFSYPYINKNLIEDFIVRLLAGFVIGVILLTILVKYHSSKLK